MREKRTVQARLFEAYAEHEIGRELKAMSDWLDQNIDLLDWVAADVKQRNVEETAVQETVLVNPAAPVFPLLTVILGIEFHATDFAGLPLAFTAQLAAVVVLTKHPLVGVFHTHRDIAGIKRLFQNVIHGA